MPHYSTEPQHGIHPDQIIKVPGMQFPSYRKLYAEQRGALDRIMIQVRGGIGDCICAEPAIRYAINNFSNKIYVATHFPDFYRHLKLEGIFNVDKEMPVWEDYLNYHTIALPDEVPGEFFVHMTSHIIDYHTMLMWHVQLPPEEKSVILEPNESEKGIAANLIDPINDILIHAGSTWPSRTLPKAWWDAVTDRIFKLGKQPVLIGAKSFNNCTTVDLDTTHCLDLRDKFSLMASVAICQRAQVLLTNDSSPLHMAASGDAWIGYVSTVKPPHLLTHYRKRTEGWRMQNFSTDWLCNYIDMSPTNSARIEFDKADPAPWLCSPEEIAEWAVSKL